MRKYIATAHEYLMVYGKNESETSLFDAPLTEQQKKDYREVDVHGQLYRLLGLRKRGAFSQRSERPNLHYPLYVDPETKGVFVDKEHDTYIQVVPKLSDGTDGVWRWSKPKVARERGKLEARIVAGRDEWDVFEKDYLMAHDSEKTTMYKSIWIDKGVNYEFGKQSLKSLFGRAPFDTPKPVMLLQKVLAMGARDDDIVMDFFAGSCTFCQAVLEQNRKDGGRRRFIAAQMPEPISDPEFSTIAAVGLERIRRVIRAMANADEGKLPLSSDEDLGFRVFKLAESHIRLWRGLQNVDTAEYAQQMALFADPLQSGWQSEAVIYEVAIREGFGLNCQVRQLEEMAENTVYRVHDPDKGQSFTICLDDHVTTGLVQDRLRLGRDDLFICRDVALDDETAANIALQCRVKTI